MQSHRKAVAAHESGTFTARSSPVEIAGQGRGHPRSTADESPRKDTSLESLAKLKPVFRKDGSVTAGNAPGLNDGASALVVTSLAFAKAHGLTPMARVTAVRHRRRRAEGSLLRADPRGAEPDEEGRHHDRRLRPDRGQRGLRGAGHRRRPRARLGLGPRQRERRRGGARPPDRRQRRPGADHAALRHEGSRRRRPASRPSASAAATPWR